MRGEVLLLNPSPDNADPEVPPVGGYDQRPGAKGIADQGGSVGRTGSDCGDYGQKEIIIAPASYQGRSKELTTPHSRASKGVRFIPTKENEQ